MEKTDTSPDGDVEEISCSYSNEARPNNDEIKSAKKAVGADTLLLKTESKELFMMEQKNQFAVLMKKEVSLHKYVMLIFM